MVVPELEVLKPRRLGLKYSRFCCRIQRKAPLHGKGEYNLEGSFFQNSTASLYVSAEWGVVGHLGPATSPTLAKFLRPTPSS